MDAEKGSARPSHQRRGYDGAALAIKNPELVGRLIVSSVTVGDCDAVKLDHAIRFLRLRGGDVNGDFVGVPSPQLACSREPRISSVLPGPNWSWMSHSGSQTHRHPKADHADDFVGQLGAAPLVQSR
jgi:hypothetical protein